MRELGLSETVTAAETSIIIRLEDSHGTRRCQVSKSIFVDTSPIIRDLSLHASANEVIEFTAHDVTVDQLRQVEIFLERRLGLPSIEIERPLRAELQAIISEWDYDFIHDVVMQGMEMNVLNVVNLLKAATLLGVTSLKDLCAAATADWLRNKSDEQVLSAFGIAEPYSTEIDRRIGAVFPWLAD